MPRNLPRVVLAGRTAAQRRASRQGISLRDFSITEKTRRRYLSAVGRLLPFLEQHGDPHTYDSVISEWIEFQWARGEALTIIADSLSGLQFFWPELKGIHSECRGRCLKIGGELRLQPEPRQLFP